MASSVAYAEPRPAASRPVAPLRDRLVAAMPTDRVWGWLGPLLVTVLAGWLRFDRLAAPGKLVFDEVYYAIDSWNVLHAGVELNKAGTGPGFVVHPPLGKWMIAVGQAMFGHNAFGWRFSAAVVGSLSVLIVARTGRRLFRSTLLGCIAGLLLALDGLEFVQSRIAMLDIFMMFWVVAGLACLVADRDWSRVRLAAGASTRWRPWRIATAVCLGAGSATKWNMVPYVAMFVLLAFVWDTGTRRVLGDRRPILNAVRRDALSMLGTLVGLGAVIYVVSWTGWFVGGRLAWDHNLYLRPGQNAIEHAISVVHGWLKYHSQMWHFHETLTATHPYQSHPAGWLLLARPVAYFYAGPKFGVDGCRAVQGCSQEILAIGTPAIWWASIPMLVAMVWRWIAHHDWRAAVVLLGVATAIVPWIEPDLMHRTEFLFYALPAVPFMALGLAMCAGWVLGGAHAALTRRITGSAVVAGYLLIVAWNFFYFYPILAAKVIPYPAWQARMWFGSWI